MIFHQITHTTASKPTSFITGASILPGRGRVNYYNSHMYLYIPITQLQTNSYSYLKLTKPGVTINRSRLFVKERYGTLQIPQKYVYSLSKRSHTQKTRTPATCESVTYLPFILVNTFGESVIGMPRDAW